MDGNHVMMGAMLALPEAFALAAVLAAAGAPFPGPRGEVILPSGAVLQVELADTPAKRATGYMFRESISPAEGMVFFHDELGFHSFWMKNCRVGLDIIWLDENWSIVHIERNLPPCQHDPCPSYTPMRAARYVLEMQAGGAAHHGLALGNSIIYVPPGPPSGEKKKP